MGDSSAPAVEIRNPVDLATSAAAGGTVLVPAAAKPKSSLVVAAATIDRSRSTCSGYLKKQNSEGRWQKRYFVILENFWAYYKTSSIEGEPLCAMDLWRAGTPAIVPSATGSLEDSCEFCITWDRYRLFRAGTPAEARKWVHALQAAQALRPSLVMEGKGRGTTTGAAATGAAHGNGAGSNGAAANGTGGAAGMPEDWTGGQDGNGSSAVCGSCSSQGCSVM